MQPETPQHERDVTFSKLLELHPHIASGSLYHRLFNEAYEATSLADARINQSIKYLRQALLFQSLQRVLTSNIEGDFAECGCFRGQAIYMMARTLQEYKRDSMVHAFDSFQGLSSFVGEDDAGLGTKREQELQAHFAFPQAEFERVMHRFSSVRIHPGWIPSRFDEVADRTFALVHIDVDLYEPTRDCLNFFYPRLARGGFIIVDDYNAKLFPGCNMAVDQFVQTHRPPFAMPGQIGSFVISG